MRSRYYLILGLITSVIFLWIFLTFKLLEVPSGITVDEAAFGYNGVLLSKTLKDENGRFLPVFVLSIHGKDWRQPVTQYLTAATFRIFGSSFYNLRAISVGIIIASYLLIFLLLYKYKGLFEAILGGIFFITTPIIFMHSHMGLDNIAPLPFVVGWILGIFYFNKTKSIKYLILAGVSLGVSIYSYKAMRLIVPVWMIITSIYLLRINTNLGNLIIIFKKNIKYAVVFLLSILPFFVVMPILELKYAGAIMGGATASINSYDSFFIGYLSNLDLSFLYITGDITSYHSTGRHGTLLLVSFIFFIFGATRAIKEKGFLLFILICFLLAPLLFGFVGSIHRASRLISMVPLYVIICTAGVTNILATIRVNGKRVVMLVTLIIFLLIGLNFGEFLHYYWFKYPIASQESFKMRADKDYQELAQKVKELNRTPMIDKQIYEGDDIAALFFLHAYIGDNFKVWNGEKIKPSEKVILMTHRKEIEGFENITDKKDDYYLQINK